MTTTLSTPSATPAGRPNPDDDRPDLIPSSAPAELQPPVTGGLHATRRLTGQSDGGTINDGRGIQAACRARYRAGERRVQRLVADVRLPLDDMTAEQTKPPAHQLVRRRPPTEDLPDPLDLQRRERRRRRSEPGSRRCSPVHTDTLGSARIVRWSPGACRLPVATLGRSARTLWPFGHQTDRRTAPRARRAGQRADPAGPVDGQV